MSHKLKYALLLDHYQRLKAVAESVVNDIQNTPQPSSYVKVQILLLAGLLEDFKQQETKEKS